MIEIRSEPNASALMESTRSVGYSFESAIADIIDNSISAKAKNIWIQATPSSNPYVAILDDGIGMSSEELKEAMRYGVDPNIERSDSDLGRFGLGLKMASLSQCRKLTVISMFDCKISACRWDLDRVIEKNDWVIQVLDESEIEDVPLLSNLKANNQGTIVLWQSLDRLLDKAKNINEYLAEVIVSTCDHISLTFHRFMSEEAGNNRLKIHFNDNLIHPADPFLTNNPKTEKFPEQVINICGQDIVVKSFILPPVSKMDTNDKKLIGDLKNLRRLQGFYVYRNKRLIIPGTWFKLTESKELRKLARVRVDIPNTSDFLWDIDIKKSTASLPLQLRGAFVQFLGNVTSRSEQVHQFRGRKTTDKVYVWDRLENREGFQYTINMDHPLIVNYCHGLGEDSKKDFRDILNIIESSVPFKAIYVDVGSGNEPQANKDPEFNEKIYIAGLELIKQGIGLDKISTIEPWIDHPEIISKLRDIV